MPPWLVVLVALMTAAQGHEEASFTVESGTTTSFFTVEAETIMHDHTVTAAVSGSISQIGRFLASELVSDQTDSPVMHFVDVGSGFGARPTPRCTASRRTLPSPDAHTTRYRTALRPQHRTTPHRTARSGPARQGTHGH